MIDPQPIADLARTLDALRDFPEVRLENGAEIESRYTLRIAPSGLDSFSRLVALLGANTHLFDLSIELSLAQGSARLVPTPDSGLQIVEPWLVDPDQTPDEISESASQRIQETVRYLSAPGQRVNREILAIQLEKIQEAGAAFDLSLLLNLDKCQVIERMKLPGSSRGLLYLSTQKLTAHLGRMDLPALDRLFTPDGEEQIVLLLGDASGSAEGPCLRILGRDRWPRVERDGPAVDRDRAARRIRETILFRDQECHWETGIRGLTPFHLQLETRDAPGLEELVEALGRAQNRLCVAYLANRARFEAGQLICEFQGHRRAQAAISPGLDDRPSPALFELFAWAYQDHSSDKLGILRQILTLQLRDDPVENYSSILKRAKDLLSSAKGNFQYFLKRNVDEYFEKRLKVNEYLQQFSGEVYKSISEISGELLNNVYKTIGIILGVIIANLVDPQYSGAIIRIAAWLYIIYIGFTLSMLFFTYRRYSGVAAEYQRNIEQLQDVLLVREIDEISGGAFRRVRREFLLAFSVANFIYMLLGGLAYLFIKAMGGM